MHVVKFAHLCGCVEAFGKSQAKNAFIALLDVILSVGR